MHITATGLATRTAGVLAEHPGVVDVLADEDATGAVRVLVVPLPGAGRVPASGRCALIDPEGRAVEGVLRDVSLAGIGVAVDGEPPELGTVVQMWIEADALGAGVDGWLGKVCWVHEDQVGVAFAGNFDEGLPLVRLLRAFSVAAQGRQFRHPPIDAGTRARIGRPAVMQVGTIAVEAFAVDASEIGVGLRTAEPFHLDLPGRDVQVRVEADGLWRKGVHGTVVRMADRFAGVALRPTSVQRRSLRALVEQTVLHAVVTPEALQAWLASRGVPRPAELRLVDVIARR